MPPLTLLELKERIADRLDPDLVLETLDINTEELLDAFEDRLELNRDKFTDVDNEDYDDYNTRGANTL